MDKIISFHPFVLGLEAMIPAEASCACSAGQKIDEGRYYKVGTDQILDQLEEW